MSPSSSNDGAAVDAAPFAELVRRAMGARGLGLRELCRAADIDPSFLSKVLSGKRNPPAEEDALRRLAGALGLDATRLTVSAGRIPSAWRRVRVDEDAFRSAHALITGSAARVEEAPAAPARGWRSAPRPAPARPEPRPRPAPDLPLRPSRPFGEELL